MKRPNSYTFLKYLWPVCAKNRNTKTLYASGITPLKSANVFLALTSIKSIKNNQCLDDLEHVTNIELALATSKSKKMWV